MRKLILLLKLQLSSLFGLSVIRSTKSAEQRKQAKRARTLSLVTVVACVVMSCFYSTIMAKAFGPLGLMNVLLMVMMMGASVIALISSIARVKSVLFGFGDYDLMMSLPVKPSTVAISRLIAFYMLDLLFAVALLIPAGVVYGTYMHPSASFYVILLVMTLFVPLIPLAIGGALGTLFGAAFAKFKFKNVLSTIVQSLFLVGIMALSFASSSIEANIGSFAEAISGKISSIYPPVTLFSRAVCDGDAGSMLLFVGISAALAALFCLMVVLGFKKLSTIMKAVYRNGKFRFKKQQGRSARVALYINEFRRYTSCTIYFLNTAFSAIIVLLAIGYIAIFGNSQVRPLLLAFTDYSQYYAPVLATVLAWLFCISPSTTACISIEGKRLWLAKLLPIKANDWFSGKILVALTFVLPVAIVASVVFPIALGLGALAIIEMLAILVPYIYFFTVLGLWINIKNHRFDWKNEQEIVKQGSPVLILMLCSMAGTILPMVLTFALGQWWVCYAASAVYLVTSIALRQRLARDAEILKQKI